MAVKDLIPLFRNRAPATADDTRHPLLALHEEMNRLLGGFWRELDGDGLWPDAAAFPRVEVSETESAVRVHADLPGLDDKDVELLLDGNMLILRGERMSETHEASRHVSERFYGRFERRIGLPVEVQADRITASFARGVLTVTLPKQALAVEPVKRIPINKR